MLLKYSIAVLFGVAQCSKMFTLDVDQRVGKMPSNVSEESSIASLTSTNKDDVDVEIKLRDL